MIERRGLEMVSALIGSLSADALQGRPENQLRLSYSANLNVTGFGGLVPQSSEMHTSLCRNISDRVYRGH